MRVHLDINETTHIAYGTDHIFGYFVQVWSNRKHDGECRCTQCEYDSPVIESDNLGSWHGVIDFVKERLGVDITGHIVGVGPDFSVLDAEKLGAALTAQ